MRVKNKESGTNPELASIAYWLIFHAFSSSVDFFQN